MRTVGQVVGIGLAATLGSVTIALSRVPASASDEAWASSGLAQLDVGLLACDMTLPAEGPSPEALRERLRAATPRFMPCLAPSADAPQETLRLQLTVDCSGSLSGVEVVEAGDWPDHVVSCTRASLAGARFPAHGLIDGFAFDFPVRYTAAK
ncbi:MAG: hypothetical protein AAGA48_38450 [Myxococcota bacterium]